MKRTIFLTALILYALCSCTQEPYKNSNLSAEARAEDLVKRLTLEEKETLMMNSSEAVFRLGIKKYDWWNEALHGVARNGTATVFPQAIGMAASFDDQFLHEVFTVISDEARIKHRIARENDNIGRYRGLTMWTPNINIFRDPRWGRGQETYGEDPYLTSIMGVAVIKGLQGETTNGIDKLHACAKHYAVHSGPEWNRHNFNAENIKPRDLWETYLPAFKAAVEKGNVKEVMCAYNRFEGEPCCGNDQLLTSILREKWGYEGIILSDCGAIRNFYLPNRHETHPDAEHATADAIISGTDLECGSSYNALVEAIKSGQISEAQVDVSVKRLLKARFELGEMDGTSPWDHLPDSLVNSITHQKMALTMAEKTMVLLQNNGILPLKNPKRIALLGPNADNAEMQWGNYNGIPKHTVTLLEGLKMKLPDTDIIYDRVSDHTGDVVSLVDECNYNDKAGIKAVYWNNTNMQGKPAANIYYQKVIKVGKRDTVASGMNLNDISAKFKTVFTPTETGEVEFVFTTSSHVKFTINDQEIELQKIPIELQVSKMKVEKGTSYKIEIEQVHSEQGQFRFDIIRRIDTDIDRIVELIKGTDIVVYAGGINAALEREESNIYAPGFMGGDRTSIELPEAQREVIARLKQEGKKVILVNFSGSAMGLEPETKNCEAIIQAWYPGERGGEAIANVLTGEHNPAGRLPVTFYKNVDQLPDFEDYNMTNRTYRFMHEKPLFEFGYGLGYTSFEYGNPSINQAEICIGDAVNLTIPLTNTGIYDGDEVVQVYFRRMNDSDGPVKTLRAFKRVHVPKGKTVNVSFELSDENLEWWDKQTHQVHMHAGEYQLMIGGSSADNNLKTIPLTISK
ncbi:MAG: glycoside hydrolase family 3 C-terminal domain-containing protein [Prolixibacteraceae bacterium]|nr:glycoside hydrolase family 3 C-terminal domain-containing protein [Prolixibacteraceae bacterium]